MQINQLPAASSLNNQDKFAIDTIDGITKSITASALVALTRTNSYGAPLEASTVAGMTDTSKVYVYTGNESGYTNGNWYYYNGTAWVSGGVYNSVAVTTDKTLSLSNVAADAKAVGDADARLSADIAALDGTLSDQIQDIFINTATDYDSLSFPVSEGQYCLRRTNLFKARQDIPTIEAWNIAHWEQVNIGDELYGAGEDVESAVAAEATAREAADTALSGSISAEATAREAADDELKSAIAPSSIDVLELCGDFSDLTGLPSGVDYTFTADHVCDANGTAVGVSAKTIFYKTGSLPDCLKAGKTYPVIFFSTSTDLFAQIYFFDAVGTTSSATNVTQSGEITIPSNAVGMQIRYRVLDGRTVSHARAQIVILTAESNNDLSESIKSLATAVGTKQDALTFDSVPTEGSNNPVKSAGVYTAVNDLRSASVYDLSVYGNHASATSASVSYTYNGNNTWTVDGTPDGVSFNNLFVNTDSPYPFVHGRKYYFWVTATSANVYLQFFKLVGGTSTIIETIYRNNADFTVVEFPDDATGVTLRIRTGAAVSNDKISIWIYDEEAILMRLSAIKAELSQKIGFKTALTQSDDLDDLTAPGTYGYGSTSIPINAPTNDTFGGVVTVVHGSANAGFVVQYDTLSNGKLYQRWQYSDASWTNWTDITDAGTKINNTYNITTNPTITTDTNGWLQAVDTDTADETGKTDMAPAIMSMLTDTGYCHLGEGVFYVSGNIDLPDNAVLCGCGEKTEIRLLQSVTTGYAAKIARFNTIKDIVISGSRSGISPSAEGSRNGIHFVADYEGTPQVRSAHCAIDNVIIKNFTGSGLYSAETTLSPQEGLFAINLYVINCYAGINLQRYSEFNRFVNAKTSNCYYGVINNGGNNMFTSCIFRANSIAFYIDGSFPNSAHGMLIGCEFAHIGENEGIAIKMENVSNGFTISNCMFGYCYSDFYNCSGINFTGCHFIRGRASDNKTIVINGGNTFMFTSCLFSIAPDITIANNNKVKFNACYEQLTGDPVTAN